MPDTNPGLMTIFSEAMEQADQVTRAAYLNRVCGDDADLRRRVEELLAAHAGAGRFIDGDAPNAATLTFTGETGALNPNATGAHEAASAPRPKERPPSNDSIGNIIAGRCTLLRAIGEGGMGLVYLAEQTEPVKRQVALKLIKAGMDSKAVLARFDAERQALALMDHPNIARIYDGGVADRAQPYFVMELVKGIPLTEFCDSRYRQPKLAISAHRACGLRTRGALGQCQTPPVDAQIRRECPSFEEIANGTGFAVTITQMARHQLRTTS